MDDALVPISRVAIETALDELILNQRGADLQRIVLPLAKRRCPELVANELSKDGGEDGFIASTSSSDAPHLAVASSITAKWSKVRADIERIRERKPRLERLWFYTPHSVSALLADSWISKARAHFGVDLVVFPREDLVQELLRPDNRYLLENHLRLPRSTQPPTAFRAIFSTSSRRSVANTWVPKRDLFRLVGGTPSSAPSTNGSVTLRARPVT